MIQKSTLKSRPYLLFLAYFLYPEDILILDIRST